MPLFPVGWALPALSMRTDKLVNSHEPFKHLGGSVVSENWLTILLFKG